jgi:D-lactate dehydrogenase (cytochrome)
MLSKSKPDEMQSYLTDASNFAGGHAARVVFPETVEEVAEVLASASGAGTAVTVAGAGTGLVGGRVPFGGIVLATDKLNRIKEVVAEEPGGRATVEAGVVLADFRRAVDARDCSIRPTRRSGVVTWAARWRRTLPARAPSSTARRAVISAV